MGELIETRTQVIWLDEAGIVHTKLKAHTRIDLDDAREAVRVIASFCDAGKRPVLVDLSDLKSMTRDARVYFAGPETATFESAVALFTQSPLAKAIGNFFIGFNKPLFPTRLFTAEAAALEWLSEFRT